EILAVTFTDAAAGELRERLERELDRPLDETWIGTFHAICSRLLQEHAYQVGMPRETRVLDDVGQRLLLERLRADLRSGAEAGLTRDFEALGPDEVADLVRAGPTFVLGLKGRGIGPEEFWERALERHAATWGGRANEAPANAEREAIEVLHTVYVAYRDRLRAAGRMDFDDLILQVSDALRRVPAFREAAVRRFAHILVDEFQDTNRIQLELIRLLAQPQFANVTAVGDAKQSIYGWRDAEIENIRTRFPGERLPLTLNRRSPQEVLDLATDFIRRDEDFRDEPDLHAARGDGGLCVSVMMAPEAGTEAQRVADEIERLVRSGRSYSEIAILTSSVRKLPAAFEDELRRHGIPYVTTAGSGFFDREEVKDVLALLRLVADPMDDGALVRVLQGPVVRLGDDVLYRLAVRRLGTLEREGVDDDDPHPSIRREPGMRLRDCVERSRAEGWPEVPPAAARRVVHVLGVLDRLGETRDAMTVGDLLNHVLEDSGYLRHCQLRARREGPRALRNLRKVFAMATRFERDQGLAGIIDFVTHLDQVMDAAVPVAEAEQEEADAVRLLTVHAAKGLEFPVVFLVNLNRPRTRDTEKLFFEPETFGFLMKWWRGRVHPRYEEHGPGTHAVTQALQERRRVVYVALTRAQDLLYVSATRTEEHPEDVDVELDDHFAEILQWALARPEAARVIQADQLELPGAAEASATRDGGRPPDL
ncbi:MAG: ATP-dependent helicase, partial [Candidatus Dormibacteraeota bacterium]|nr:ATP-dependent helicase [Candidatus Dormibacteraeota bacterium]